jgi:hypothetical protein
VGYLLFCNTGLHHRKRLIFVNLWSESREYIKEKEGKREATFSRRVLPQRYSYIAKVVVLANSAITGFHDWY